MAAPFTPTSAPVSSSLGTFGAVYSPWLETCTALLLNSTAALHATA